MVRLEGLRPIWNLLDLASQPLTVFYSSLDFFLRELWGSSGTDCRSSFCNCSQTLGVEFGVLLGQRRAGHEEGEQETEQAQADPHAHVLPQRG